MIQNDLEYKYFSVVRAIALENIGRQKVYWNSDDLAKRINKPGLEDARALLRIFEKELKDHNSKLDADESRIRNLNYKSSNVYKSKYFNGINLNKVFKAVDENPQAEIWEIAKQFIIY